MDKAKLHGQFRKQLTAVHGLTVFTVFLFELVGYIVLIRTGNERFAFNSRFLWLGLVVPSAINVATHLAARSFVNTPGIHPKVKNAAIIAATLVTSLVVAVAHKAYIVTSCAFVFPMILSAMFHDKKLLTTSFLCSLFILGCVVVAFLLDGTATLTDGLNLFVLFGFAIISFFCGVISINFSKLNYSIIKSQKEQNNQLREDLLRDQMTGLYDHQTFVTQLDALIRSANTRTRFCLVMLDLDDFKKINDTFGHDCGDEVLLFLSTTLQKFCGVTDTAYRYGGEEFAIIFRKKNVWDVYAIMQNMLVAVRSHRFSFTSRSITFSAGIAQYTAGMTGDELFEAADQTLYAAKGSGKNQILIDT